MKKKRKAGGSGRPSRLIVRFLDPFQAFFRTQAASGVLLLLAAITAIIWANSSYSPVLTSLLHTHFRVGFDGFSLDYELHHWINDGLMAVFFLLVGLEIKRELVNGELASPRRALLPIAAAVGGMVVPAAIYALFNHGGPGRTGWGIPMATDIAFALGCAALLGRRIPSSLVVFLTALAIVDDLGAVLVIAIFYTSDLSWGALGLGGLVFMGLIGLNLADVRRLTPYLVLGFLLWLAFLKSGVHATIAGVLLGMVIPANTRASLEVMLDSTDSLVQSTRDWLRRTDDIDARNDIKDNTLMTLTELTDDVEAPGRRLEETLHPWSSFFIMPVFALANAGIVVSMAEIGDAFTQPITTGIFMGLLLGKPIGVTLACWAVIRLGMATLPSGARWSQLFGVSILAGIGFTMSLFINGLALTNLDLQLEAKVGIFAASIVAGVVGSLYLWLIGRRRTEAA